MNWSVYPADALQEHGAEWDTINDAASNLPILDSRFFRFLLEVSGTGNALLAICRDEKKAVAAGIFRRTKWGVWQTFQPSQAPLGAWVQRPSLSAGELLESLGVALPGFWLLIGLTQLDPEIISKPVSQGSVRVLDYNRTARLTISGSLEDYWTARGKNLRKNLKRQRNRLAREELRTRLEHVLDVKDVGEAVDDYGVLESKGWKASEGTAMHPTNPQGRFYRGLLEDSCSRGEGSVFRYFYNDELVASDICLNRDGVLILLKTTYDEKQTTTSPSLLMREEIISELFQRGTIDRIEFYGRVMEWHTKWTTEFRELYHLNYFRWSCLSHASRLKR